MSINNVTSSSKRLTGMFSGMDTDSLVTAMVSNQQLKVTSLLQSKTKAEWKKQAYTDFNSQLKTFRDTFGSVLGESSLLSKGTYADFSINLADTSGFKVTAAANARAGSYNISVEQLASAASMRGAELTESGKGYTDSELAKTKLSDLNIGGAAFSDSIKFSINGKEFSFESSTTVKSMMDTINSSKAGVTVAYSQINDRITITANQTGAMKGLEDPGDEPGADATSADKAAWNTAKANYTDDQKKTISFEDSTGFLSFLGLDRVTAGQNAKVNINGESREMDSNFLSVDGLQITLLRTTSSSGIDFDVEKSTGKAVESIKKMVEQFNEMVSKLFTSYNQKVDRDYYPLTDDMKAEMSEKEIEKWEEVAKEGILYRDNNLSKALDSLRGLLTKSFGDSGKLSSIGITTAKYSVGEAFKLEVDEDKLRAALEKDTDSVYNMFAAASSSDSAGGFMIQANAIIDNFTGGTKSRELQNLTTDISNYTKRIKEQETKLSDLTESYYLKYAKMEQALSEMQSQQNSMSSLFGTGS